MCVWDYDALKIARRERCGADERGGARQPQLLQQKIGRATAAGEDGETDKKRFTTECRSRGPGRFKIT